jgi:transposase
LLESRVRKSYLLIPLSRFHGAALAWHRDNAVSQRLETIPGVGLITATALAASVGDPEPSGRAGTSRRSSGWFRARPQAAERNGSGASRRWATAICVVFWVIGATSVVRRAGACTTGTGAWLRHLLGRKPARLVTVAMANKTARIAWAVMAHGEEYREA